MSHPALPRLERLPDVCARTGLAKTTIYRLIREGKFPAPVPLAGRTRAWSSVSVDDWIAACIAAGTNKGVLPNVAA